MPFTLKESGLVTADYIMFFVLCISSCAGGIWHSAKGSRSHKVKDIRDYLLGGRELSTFPVALSLIASYVSGVTILGTPAEIYNYGTQYWLIIVGVSVSCIIVVLIYLPVFHTLHLSSSYEYLELRFNRQVRTVASVLFLLDEVLFLPMVVYVPALAFNQVTGFNVYIVGAVMVVLCGLYTVLGGLRAVVWTDSVQTGIMYVGVILVAIAGTVTVGGFNTVINAASQNGRWSLSNWSFSPYERQTGWGVIVGGSVYWTCFNSVNQTMVQRYISLSTQRKAVISISIFACGAIIAISLCVWCGLAAWATWSTTGCVPTGCPIVDDRLLPAYVIYITTSQKLPGLSGVFLAGVFGAGLSSLSAVLNACALVGVEDILRGWFQLRLKPLYEGIFARLFTAVLAILSVIMLVVVSKLGGILGVATALSAIAASTTCGVFTLGMVCWWVGPYGAIAGAIMGALMAGTVSVGTQAAAAAGLRGNPTPFGSECAANASFVAHLNKFDPQTVFPLFRVSYHWIAPIGLLATLVVGAIVGWLFDKTENLKMDTELFTPCVWRWLPQVAHDNAGRYRTEFARRCQRRDPSLALMLSLRELKDQPDDDDDDDPKNNISSQNEDRENAQSSKATDKNANSSKKRNAVSA